MSASPQSLKNASVACVRTSPPSSTSASHRRNTPSPGNTVTPSRVSHPAHRRDGRTDASASASCNAGNSCATAASSADASAHSDVADRENNHGARSSANAVSIQNAVSSSSVTRSNTPATVHIAGTYPCGDLATVAVNTRSSASNRQYSRRSRRPSLPSEDDRAPPPAPSLPLSYPRGATHHLETLVRTNRGWSGKTSWTSPRMRRRASA